MKKFGTKWIKEDPANICLNCGDRYEEHRSIDDKCPPKNRSHVVDWSKTSTFYHR